MDVSRCRAARWSNQPLGPGTSVPSWRACHLAFRKVRHRGKSFSALVCDTGVRWLAPSTETRGTCMTGWTLKAAKVVAMVGVLIAGVGVSAALADSGNGRNGNGNGSPTTVPGSPGDDCSHGNSGKDCRPDPNQNGKDCEDHGNAKGNEDHCDQAETTTTVPTTTNETTTTKTRRKRTTTNQTTTERLRKPRQARPRRRPRAHRLRARADHPEGREFPRCRSPRSAHRRSRTSRRTR